MSTFTIPFPEYDIADYLQKKYLKKDNFSVAIPFSRQQKFFDLVLLNGKSKKFVTIQVKSSRTYVKHSEKSEYQYESWLNYFDIKDNYSNFYFVYMTYPELDENYRPKATWGRKILVFNQNEMNMLLSNLKTKAGKQERFFSFAFDKTGGIYGTRGFKHLDKREFSAHLLENKLDEIKSELA